jgi:hypothetical protein
VRAFISQCFPPQQVYLFIAQLVRTKAKHCALRWRGVFNAKEKESMNMITFSKQLTAYVLMALFVLTMPLTGFAQRPGGQGRPSGQRPPDAGRRENAPPADKQRNGPRRPPESRNGNGRPTGTFSMPQGAFPRG